jgi:creatinine amidohydrolase
MKNMIDMSWTDIENAVNNHALVLFPLGVLEEHGPHLCLGTDMYTAQVHCSYIQKKLQIRGLNSVVAPPFYWGICQSTKNFIGSFTIRMDTAKALVVDIIHSLSEFGFTEVFGVNAHGDIEQHILCMESFKEAYEKTGIQSVYCFPKDRMHFYGLRGDEKYICPVEPQMITISSSDEPDIHGGDIETAVIQSFYPQSVNTSLAKKLPPVRIDPEKEMEWMFGGKTHEMSPNGYVGNPSKFDEVQIEKHLNDVSERYVHAILQKRMVQ